MADSNYSDIRSLHHSNYSSTKYHIRFSPTDYTSFVMAMAQMWKDIENLEDTEG